MKAAINEDAVEQALLEWLAGLGWATAHGPDISPPDAKTPGTERANYREDHGAETHRMLIDSPRRDP